MKGASVDSLVNRDWVGIRVFMNTVKFVHTADLPYTYCTSYTCYCCTTVNSVTTCGYNCCCISPTYYYL